MVTLYKQTKRRFVRELQKKATPAEIKLRNLLVQYHIKYNFQRAFTIRDVVDEKRYKRQSAKKETYRFYIADFYLPQYATIIELDGDVHQGTNQNIKDNARTLDILQGTKLVDTILRFHNNQVLQNGQHVIRTILMLKPVR